LILNIHQGHTNNVEFSLNGFDILEFIVGRFNKICAYGVFDHIGTTFLFMPTIIIVKSKIEKQI